MKNSKIIIIIIVVLALVLIGVGVSFTLTNNGNSKEQSTNKKENKMNNVHTKNGIKVTSLTVTKSDTGTKEFPKYKVSAHIVNETGKDIVSVQINFKLLCENGEKRDFTAFVDNLKKGKSIDYSRDTGFDLTDFYDYEMEVTISDELIMGY